MKDHAESKKKGVIMTFLTEDELTELITYSGLDLVLSIPGFKATPVIYFFRSSSGKVKFTTIVKKNLAESIF